MSTLQLIILHDVLLKVNGNEKENKMYKKEEIKQVTGFFHDMILYQKTI